jgi:DNA sulfur modification protein DndE
MEALTIQRVPFTKDADNKLRALKARTGITPNILCRIGFCMSLEVPTEPACQRQCKNDPPRQLKIDPPWKN